MGREENIRIFEDTEIMCKTNLKLSTNIARSRRKQTIILDTDRPDCRNAAVYEKYAEVIVSKKRTLEAASYYKDYKTAVLNFASASNPGGGVVHGSSAQEECLCRCSTLYFSLDTPEMWNGFYTPHRKAQDPIHNDDIIYTPDVTVFKTDTDSPETMTEADWYNVDVITCAAPNLKQNPTNIFNPADGATPVTITDVDLLALHEKRLSRILDVAKANRIEVIILGAFGCGAFKNKPEVVALAAKNVLKDYLNSFKFIEYAIYSRRNNNYQIFERTLKPLTR
jgi:uncharacterized protein (TIGR02452 family)